MTDPEQPLDDEIEWVSKSEMKRDMHKLQALGERLLKVKASNLVEFPLSDELTAAIEESKRIKSNEAMRRHLQYIGKLMRDVDVDAIQDCLDKLDPSSELYQRVQNQSELWRQKLLKTDTAEREWFEQYPETERQSFRSLVRAAKKEQHDDLDSPIVGGKNSKNLLQRIKEQFLN